MKKVSATTDPQIEVANLKARKMELAYKVVQGDNFARAELTDINHAIAGLEQEIELRQLADSERQRLEAEAEKERLAAERKQKEALLQEKRTEYDDKLADLEKRFQSLAPQIEDAIQKGKEVYALSTDLGLRPRWRVKADIANALKAAVSLVLHPEIEWVSPIYRSLIETPSPRSIDFEYCADCGGSIPQIPGQTVVHNCTAKRGGVGLTASEEFVRMSADGTHAIVREKKPEATGEVFPSRLPGETDEERETRLKAKLKELNDGESPIAEVAA